MDPLESIAQEAEGGAVPGGFNDDQAMAPEGPRFGQRFGELFSPCPEDPAESVGSISQAVNGWLSKRSGVPEDHITVGENLAHCVNHLFPGGGSGLPPIVGLAKSLVEFRFETRKLAQPEGVVGQ